TFKKLFIDDYFVLLALSMVFASGVIWQFFVQRKYYVLRVTAGLEIPGEDFIQVTESYLKAQFAVLILYFSALCENGRQAANKPVPPGPSSFFVRGGGRRIKMSDILDSLTSRLDDSHSGHQQQSDNTSDVPSVVENHSQGSYSLYEIPHAA
ncbi:MAG: hypothetical protein Q9226_003096, partial [Calogaya cf. arnoldii]